MGVAESSECEGAAGDEEGGPVSDLRVCAGEEHDVAAHHEGCADDEEDGAAVKLPAEKGNEDRKEGADHVRRHGVELLRNDAAFGVDCLNDRGGEEGDTLDGDIVKEEYEGGRHSNGAEDTAKGLRHVELVQDFGGSNTL